MTKNLTYRKLIAISTSLILIIFFSYFYAKKRNDFLDFYISMTDREIVYGVHDTPQAEKDWMVVLKNLYDKNHFVASDYESQVPKIPQIVHHIWLGSEFPAAYKAIRESWFEKHPGWIFKLWTDCEVEPFNLENKNLYDMAKNYGEKSDVFRYEILRRYGGTYSDTDVVCLKPLNVLHNAHDFYTGIMNAGEVLIAIGLIGCTPYHPLLDSVIHGIEDKGSKYNTVNIMERTGPIHFTKVFVKVAPNLQGNIIAYPATYFYPVPNLVRGQACHDNQHKFIKPESFTVHYWECSWMRPAAFVGNSDTVKNEEEIKYTHQSGLDKFLDEHFKLKKRAVFVDVNASDRVDQNPSLFFEKCRNWSGICMQPKMSVFKRIANQRNAFCTRAVLNGDFAYGSTKSYDLGELLKLCKFDRIDLLCVQSDDILRDYDAYEILKNIDFANVAVDTICVKIHENDISEIDSLLKEKNFKQIKNIDQYWIYSPSPTCSPKL